MRMLLALKAGFNLTDTGRHDRLAGEYASRNGLRQLQWSVRQVTKGVSFQSLLH